MNYSITVCMCVYVCASVQKDGSFSFCESRASVSPFLFQNNRTTLIKASCVIARNKDSQAFVNYPCCVHSKAVVVVRLGGQHELPLHSIAVYCRPVD